MDFYEVVSRRRSVREFEPKTVENEKLLRVLTAGLKAPSHNHLREWEFILLRDLEQRKRVVETKAKADDATEKRKLETIRSLSDSLQKKMYLKALPVQKRMMLSSPELLVVCFRMRKQLKECQTLYDLNNFASVWTCIENILLAMVAEGLCGVTYVPSETSSLKEILRIPSDYEIAVLIPIGYPKPYGVEQKTVSSSEKIHIDKW